MVKELLEINEEELMPHVVVPIIGDGGCLFRALSFLMYNTQDKAMRIRQRISKYVKDNWGDYGYLSHNPEGDNYESPHIYHMEMILPGTFGGLCELMAAAKLFRYVFEVYRDGRLYVKAGDEGNPIKRLKFSSNLSSGHFDAYLPMYEVDPEFPVDFPPRPPVSPDGFPTVRIKTRVKPIRIQKKKIFREAQ